jgi:enamine deaminase RidA (YjgF/YER057c/UK114 family)
MALTTRRYGDDSGWQEVGGYSRAVRRGGLIAVSGTTAHGVDGAALHPGDTYAQARRCLGQALAAIENLGGGIDDAVRTRVLLAPHASWEEATRAHGDVFGTVRPANTTNYVEKLIGEGFLVEIEAEAVVEP